MLLEWLCRKFGRDRVFVTLGFVAAAGFCSVLVLFDVLLGSSTVQASMPERPPVQLVKIFDCDRNINNHFDKCGSIIEQEANAWLQSVQPGARIVEKSLTAGRYHLVLAVFYELPEWRTAPKRLPTEAPAKR